MLRNKLLSIVVIGLLVVVAAGCTMPPKLVLIPDSIETDVTKFNADKSYISGLVENVGGDTARGVEIYLTFYETEKKEVISDTAFDYIGDIEPTYREEFKAITYLNPITEMTHFDYRFEFDE